MTKFLSIAAAASVALTGIAATPALADHDHGKRYNKHRNYDRYDDRGYDRQRHYDDRGYNGDNGYYRQNNYRQDHCRRGSGTTGTIIGAVAGGLLGRELGAYGRKSTTGAIVGAGAGALAGRAIGRSCR